MRMHGINPPSPMLETIGIQTNAEIRSHCDAYINLLRILNNRPIKIVVAVSARIPKIAQCRACVQHLSTRGKMPPRRRLPLR